MVCFYNTLCSNLTKSRPWGKTQRLAWITKTHLHPTNDSTIWISTRHHSSGVKLRFIGFTCHRAGPRTGPHKHISLIGFPTTSAPSPTPVFTRRGRGVSKFDVLVFQIRRTFAILGWFWSFLNSVLQVGFDYKVLLGALFHLPYWHGGFLLLSGK